jgi:tetratricopeptide (TPR) repeat protein
MTSHLESHRLLRPCSLLRTGCNFGAIVRSFTFLLLVCLGATSASGQNERVQLREAQWDAYSIPKTNFFRQIGPDKDFLLRVPVDWKRTDEPFTFEGPHKSKFRIVVEKIPDGIPLQDYVGAVMRLLKDAPGSSEPPFVRRTHIQDLEAREIVLEMPDEEGELVRTVFWILVRGPQAVSFTFAAPASHANELEPHFKAAIQSVMFVEKHEYAGFENIRSEIVKESGPAPVHEIQSFITALSQPNSADEATVSRLAALLAASPDQAVDLLLDRRPFIRAAAVRALALSHNTPLELFLWRALEDREAVVAEHAARALAATPTVMTKMVGHSMEGFRTEIIARLWPFLVKEKQLQLLNAVFERPALPKVSAPMHGGPNAVTVIVTEMTPIVPGKLNGGKPVLTFSRDPSVQLGLLTMLEEVSPTEFKLPLARIVAANHNVLTAAALQTANKRQEALPVDVLFKLVSSSDVQVSANAARSLGISAGVSDVSRIEALISQQQLASAKAGANRSKLSQYSLADELQLSIKKVRFRDQLAAALKTGRSVQEIVKPALADPKLADFAWHYSCEAETSACAAGRLPSPDAKLDVKPFAENLLPQKVQHYAAAANPGETLQRFYGTLQGIQMESARSQANLALVMGSLQRAIGQQLAAPANGSRLIDYTGIKPDAPISWAGWIAEGAPDGITSARRKALILRVTDKQRFERFIETYQRIAGSFSDLPDYLAVGSRIVPALPAILPLSAKAILSDRPAKPKPTHILKYSVVGLRELNGFQIKTFEQRSADEDGNIKSDVSYLIYLGDVAITTPNLESIRDLLSRAGSAGSDRPTLESNPEYRRSIEAEGDIVYFSDLKSLSAGLGNSTSYAMGKITESGVLKFAKSAWENTHRLSFDESEWSKPFLPFTPQELSAPRELMPSSAIAYYLMKIDAPGLWAMWAKQSLGSDQFAGPTSMWALDFEKEVLPELGPECGAAMLDLPGFDTSTGSPTWAAFCKLKSNKLADALAAGKLLRGVGPSAGTVELKLGRDVFFVGAKSGYLILSNRAKGLVALDEKNKLASTRDYSRAAEAVPGGIVGFGGYNLAAAVSAGGDGPKDGLRGQQAEVIVSLASAFHSQHFFATANAGSVQARSSVSMDREGRYAVSELSYNPTDRVTYATIDPSGLEIVDQRRLNALILRVRAKSSGALDRIREDIHLAGQNVTQKSANELEVTVEPRRTKAPEKVLLPVSDPSLASFLQPTGEIRSADERVMKQAREIAGNDRDAWSVARKLADWTYKNLTWKYVASADANRTLATMEADCSEFSQLYVAMARSVGLPARIVSGLAYSGTSFGGHAWVEVWVGRWIELDPTWGTDFVDATHLRNSSGALLTYAALNAIDLEVLETRRTVADFQLEPKALSEELSKTIPAGDNSALEAALDLGVVVDELTGKQTWAGMSGAERERMSSAYRRVMIEISSGYGKTEVEPRVIRLLHVEVKGERAVATAVLEPSDQFLKFHLLRRAGAWYLVEIVQADMDFHLISETLRPSIELIEEHRTTKKSGAAGLSDFVRVLLLMDKHAQKSLDAADAVLKTNPSRQDLKFLKALGLFVVEKEDQAVALLRELADEQFAPALYRLARHYDLSEDKAEKSQVVDFYKRYLILEPFDSRAHLALAAAHNGADNAVEAEAAYRKAIEIDPTNSEVFEAFAEFLIHRSRFSEVRAVLDLGEKLKTPPDEMFGSIMQSLYYQDDVDCAEALAASEPKRMNTSGDGNLYLAKARLDIGRGQQALPLLKRAALLKKDSADAHTTMAESYRALSRFALALNAAETAIRLEPDSGEAYYQRACALARLGRTREAMAALARAVELQPFRAMWIKEEKDLNALSRLPAFIKLVADAEEK